MKGKKEKKRLTRRLILLFILVVVINLAIRLTSYFLLSGQGQEILFPQDNMFMPRIFYLCLNSILVGLILFFVVNHQLLKPIDALTKATKEISNKKRE